METRAWPGCTAKLVSWINDQRTHTPVQWVRRVPRWSGQTHRSDQAGSLQLTGMSSPAGPSSHAATHTGAGRDRSTTSSASMPTPPSSAPPNSSRPPPASRRGSVSTTLCLHIAYRQGTLTKTYIPTSLSSMTPESTGSSRASRTRTPQRPHRAAKKDAAKTWVLTVNQSLGVSTRWAYLFAAEEQIKRADSWSSLKIVGEPVT